MLNITQLWPPYFEHRCVGPEGGSNVVNCCCKSYLVYRKTFCQGAFVTERGAEIQDFLKKLLDSRMNIVIVSVRLGEGPSFTSIVSYVLHRLFELKLLFLSTMNDEMEFFQGCLVPRFLYFHSRTTGCKLERGCLQKTYFSSIFYFNFPDFTPGSLNKAVVKLSIMAIGLVNNLDDSPIGDCANS